MKRKKCVTAGRRKKKIGILTSLALILCIGAAFGYIRLTRGYRDFLPPEHETAAVEGLPAGAASWQLLPVKEGYIVGLDTVPAYRDGKLCLNVANGAESTVWFLVRVYRENRKIAQTGILYPGEYLAEVECERGLTSGEKITLQIIAYEPETYHSEGVARIVCEVAAPGN